MQQKLYLPELVVHADWSTTGNKRWMAFAQRQDDRYIAHAAERVGDLNTLVSRLKAKAGSRGCIFAGFDFPIGVPTAYAQLARIESFARWLPSLGRGEWENFFSVATERQEISVRRPFYPRRPGGTLRKHLNVGLGVESSRQLLRICERRTANRGDACSLFWTLGGNQVGRAALSGWQGVIMPALRNAAEFPVHLWPFDGALHKLLGPDRMVIAETYPAEFYHHLGIRFPRPQADVKHGKRVQADRIANAQAMLDRARELGVTIQQDLNDQIQDGFGSSREGEDPFDAVVGLLGMLNVVVGGRTSGEPDQPCVRQVEGWILGQHHGAMPNAV